MTLKRSPMVRGKGARTKGGAGEREVCAMLAELGFEARRNFQSGGQGGGDIIGVPDHSLEVKRCETTKVWEWLAQAEAAARPTETAVVVFRRSRSPWFAVLDAETYFSLVKELQELRGER